MKDLDFDELDKAVSSLLGSSAAQPKTTAPVDPPHPEPEELTENTQPETESAPEATPAPVQKQFIQRRPTGRFMDVVHPSSDMKNAQKPTISRQAATITPLENRTPVQDSPESIVNDATAKEQPPVVDAHTQPDPLVFHGYTDTEPTSVNRPDDDEQSDVDLESVAHELHELDGLMASDTQGGSLERPFVAAPMIEKRPLGAFSAEPTTDTETVAPEEDPPKTPQTDGEPQPEAVDRLADIPQVHQAPVTPSDENDSNVNASSEPEIIPEELQDDVVAVEPEAAAEPTAITQPQATTLMGGSIPQQYAEKANQPEDEPTPIFDTTQYHQPLKHAPKQKSGWLTVVLIILLIILGIGAGAAIYIFDPFGLF